MKKVRWIVQENLVYEGDIDMIRNTCAELGIEFHPVTVIPFSPDLPDFPIDDEYENVYYGSTTFMDNLYGQLKPKGLFYNHETFTMENYISIWKDYMLNSEARIIRVSDFLKEEPTGELFFVRPDGDGKEFDGQVGEHNEIKSIISRMVEYENKLTLDSKILVGPPYNIEREWRTYIVNGEMVTASRYRKNFRLSKSGEDIPENLRIFVKERCSEYQPHDIFAMDIAEVNHDDGTTHLYIIECGCMNSVGFYHANIKNYVKSITEYMNGTNN